MPFRFPDGSIYRELLLLNFHARLAVEVGDRCMRVFHRPTLPLSKHKISWATTPKRMIGRREEAGLSIVREALGSILCRYRSMKRPSRCRFCSSEGAHHG